MLVLVSPLEHIIYERRNGISCDLLGPLGWRRKNLSRVDDSFIYRALPVQIIMPTERKKLAGGTSSLTQTSLDIGKV